MRSCGFNAAILLMVASGVATIVIPFTVRDRLDGKLVGSMICTSTLYVGTLNSVHDLAGRFQVFGAVVCFKQEGKQPPNSRFKNIYPSEVYSRLRFRWLCSSPAMARR